MPRETVNSSRNSRDSLQIIKLIIQSAYSLRCCPVSMRSFTSYGWKRGLWGRDLFVPCFPSAMSRP